MQAAFYATPILYPLSLVMEKSYTAAQLMMLNPVAQVIQATRYNMITHQTVTTSQVIQNPFWQAVPYLIVVGAIVLATIYFKSKQRYFAESV